MKKVLSVILAIALLCGTFAGLQITSHAENIAGGTLTLDEEVNVSLTGGDGKWFYFTPSEGGTYTFYTEGESDTYGRLYDSLDSFNSNEYSYSDDDSGNGLNFAITTDLVAGTQYIILCTPYSDEAEFTLKVVSGEVDFDGGGEDPPQELSDSGVCGENVTYTFDRDSGLLTISGTGDMYDYGEVTSPFRSQTEIKTLVINNGVTSIGFVAFENCSNLMSVTIGNSVTYIGGWAFLGCTGLTNVTIPDSVTSFGEGVFRGCSGLISVKISDKITNICDYTFYDCSALTSVDMPDGITNIGAYAFLECKSLTSITIPVNVTSIGYTAFYGCSGLTSVTISNNVETIEEGAFYGCISLKDIYYSSTRINWNNILIDSNNTCLTNAIIHFNSGYELTENGTCGENVTYTFDRDTGLLTISGTGDMYDYNDLNFVSPFYGKTEIKAVIINADVTSIAGSAFKDCNGLTSVIIGTGVTSINDEAFCGCTDLTNINVNAGNKKYDSRNNCNAIIEIETNTLIAGFKSTVIPNTVTSIGDYAFSYCNSLTSITIPDSVINIGDDAFSYCTGLTSITIPDSVTNIGLGAFFDCLNLANITIPDSVTSIGDSAFYDTAYYNDESNWDNGVLYIDNALIDTYYTLSGEYNIKNGTTCIADYAFSGCTDLTSVNIPDSVIGIGKYAFFGNSNYLTNINVNTGNKKYDSRNNCNAIIETETNTLIAGCKSTVIPDTVTSIGDFAFDGCSGLTSVTIPNRVTSIGKCAFRDCTGLTSVTIGDGVTSIGDSAFSYCSSLTEVTIPASVTSVGDYAFDECNSLTDVYYGGTEEEWDNIYIEWGNDCLRDATIHFNSTVGETVKYTISNLASTGGTVFVYNGSELVSSADSADGTFTLNGVGEGVYDVYVTCKFGVLTKVAMALNVDGTELEPVEDVYIPIGDVNGDGLVDVSDISSILLDGIYATSNADYDIDGSGSVDINDVSTVLLATNYGASAAVVG